MFCAVVASINVSRSPRSGFDLHLAAALGFPGDLARVFVDCSDVLHVGSIFPRSAGTISFFITFIITIGQFHPIMFPMQSVIKDSAAVWVLRLGGGAGPGVTGANTELREHGGDNRGVVK